MKRIVILSALLMLLSMPLAFAESTASTVRATDLLELPRESATLLMHYEQGVRVEVLREADTQYVQVNVGEPGGSLMGYMKKEDLVFGEENVRLNRPVENCYEQTGWTLYSYCDVRSPVLIEQSDTFLYMLGSKDEWIHAIVQMGSETITGFVSREVNPLGIGEEKRRTQYAAQIRTQPIGNEPTVEEAIALAADYLVADGQLDNVSGEPVTKERLAACTVQTDISYCYDEPIPLMYIITFFDPVAKLENGEPKIYALACLYVEDGDKVMHDYGKG